MILLDDYDTKLVIPTWLTYRKVVHSHELAIPRKDPFELNRATRKALAEDHADFHRQPTAHKAADLMAAAFVVGETSIADEMAKYVKCSPSLKEPALHLADRILGAGFEATEEPTVYRRIHQNKRFLSIFPRDPFGWIERARLHTIIGQFPIAEKCVRIAVSLAPADRYVIRSATRFFLLIGDVESAWEYVRRATSMQFDPWIKATEISISGLVKRSVKKIKELLPIRPTEDQIFHYSEFIESYGMLELLSGNEHRAKKHFKLAWLNPSKNVITHSEWIVRNRFPSLAEMAAGKFAESLEATAWQQYFNFDFASALITATEWTLEEPYAKKAFALASSLACYERDYDLGIRLTKEGLRASPKDFGLQNNLCYTLLRADRVSDAETVFAAISPSNEPRREVVYTATKGLLDFKRGNISGGRQLYRDALAKAVELGEKQLIARVALNLALTETEARTAEAGDQVTLALAHTEKVSSPEVALVKKALETAVKRAGQLLPFKAFHDVKLIPRP